MTDHDRYRDLTAAYVLGALEPDDREEVEVHLDACDRCRRDVVDFAPLPALLGRVDPEDLKDAEDPGAGADDLVAAVRADVDRLRSSRRRWRSVAGVAAAIAVVAGFAASSDDEAPTRRSDAVALDVETTAAGTTGEVLADERSWGTYVYVSVDGLPEREAYAMWVVDSAGAWEPAGTWAPTDGGAASLGGSSQLRLSEIDRVVITSTDRADEVLVAR